MMLRTLAFGAMVLTMSAPPPVFAEDSPQCPMEQDPVVSLGFGSRYSENSASRSEFDEEGDKAVTAALKPIDDFVADLARQTDIANDPDSDPEKTDQAVRCVQDAILAWARADALSDLTSQGANLSVPSRVGGIAFAYEAVRSRLTDAEAKQVIEAWLLARAKQTIAYFDADAPPRASQNNLRAWAGLAVTRIGLTLNDPALIDWGAASARLVACTAAEDGSLPNEMWRGRLALHYQLHAVAPLVTTAALLEDRQSGLFQECNGAIPRVTKFTVAALADPELVRSITGKQQSVGGAKRPPKDFELAWAAAFLRFNPDAEIEALVRDVETLGNSKLGGNQRLLWPRKEDAAQPVSD